MAKKAEKTLQQVEYCVHPKVNTNVYSEPTTRSEIVCTLKGGNVRISQEYRVDGVPKFGRLQNIAGWIKLEKYENRTI